MLTSRRLSGWSLLLGLNFLFLLAETRNSTENRVSLSGSTTTLAGLLLLFLLFLDLFLLNLVLGLLDGLFFLGFSLLLLLDLCRFLGGRDRSDDGLAQGAVSLLVCLALKNRRGQFLSFGFLGLQNSNPVIPLSTARSFKGVLVPSDGEEESNGSFGGDIGSIRLGRC
jgi:hypothetical protein